MTNLIEFRSSFTQASSVFREEYTANQRFRRMIWVVGYVLICYLIVWLSEAADSTDVSTGTKRAELARLSANSAETIETWRERQRSEQLAQDQLLASCWVANDSRLASADMQTTLQQLAGAYGLDKPRLSLSNPEQVNVENGVAWLIRARVNGRILESKLPSLVNALENSDTRFFLSEVRFVEQRGSGTLNLTLSACFLGEAQSE